MSVCVIIDIITWTDFTGLSYVPLSMQMYVTGIPWYSMVDDISFRAIHMGSNMELLWTNPSLVHTLPRISLDIADDRVSDGLTSCNWTWFSAAGGLTDWHAAYTGSVRTLLLWISICDVLSTKLNYWIITYTSLGNDSEFLVSLKATHSWFDIYVSEIDCLYILYKW